MMKYNDAYSMMGAMINQAFADQHEKKTDTKETKSGFRKSWKVLIKGRSPKASTCCTVSETTGCTCTTGCGSCL